jgi:hypothetical protein
MKNDKHIEDLLAFSLGMTSGEDGKMLIEKYKEAIANVTPFDMVKIEDIQFQMGLEINEIKKNINKVINIFYKSLKNYEWNQPKEGTFLYCLMLENRAFEYKLNKVKKIIKSYKDKEEQELKLFKKDLISHFEEFKNFDPHYSKKENILSSYVEKKRNDSRPLKLMWSLHDDIRKKLNLLIDLLNSESSTWQDLNKEIGAYYFLVFGMIQKEELVLFPIAVSSFSDNEFIEMQAQSFEYGFPFIETPEKPMISSEAIKNDFNFKKGIIQTENSEITVEQALLIFNNLPVDITFVDETDTVKFYSNPKDRIFPRSPAIIGRKVQNCHPPESVHVVEDIISAFKKGERDLAQFWLELNGKFLLIQYFAIRDNAGKYVGVLEVSQDVTEIRKLEGERRLLQWQ